MSGRVGKYDGMIPSFLPKHRDKKELYSISESYSTVIPLEIPLFVQT